MPVYAVLTGDLIVPPQAGPAAQSGAMMGLGVGARLIARWTPGWDCRFTKLSDHSWQLALNDPRFALRAALLIAARLHSAPERLTARIAIGLGGLEGLERADLTLASGTALTGSFRGLDRMARQARLVITGRPDQPLLQAVLDLSDQIARGWTREQAEAMALALPPENPTLEVMSARLGITKQAVNYRLTGAGLRGLRAALRGWEASFGVGGG